MPPRDKFGPDAAQDTLEACRALIAENIGFIEERCYRAYGIAASRYGAEDVPSANKADSLMVEVIEHLSADDYRVIREYRGKSSLKGYLNVVIANKVVDIYRGREGRSRATEEARKMGEAGVRLKELVFGRGLPVEEAHGILRSESLYAGDIETLRAMADRIGRRQVHAHREVSLDAPSPYSAEGGPGPPGGYLRVLTDEHGGLAAPDTAPGPEGEYIEKERDALRAAAIREVVGSLTPEERLMVRLRYVDGRGVKDVARAIRCTEKNAYRKLANMLERCKKMLLKKGVTTEEIL